MRITIDRPWWDAPTRYPTERYVASDHRATQRGGARPGRTKLGPRGPVHGRRRDPLCCGPAHVEELGDLGLAFYWAAIFQAGLAVAFVRSRVGGPGTWLTRIAVGGSLAVSGLWLLSRTIGLPLMPGGPEPVGTADAIGTVLQLLTVALLAVRGPALDARVLATSAASG